MVIENQNLRTSLGVRLGLTPLLARRSRAAQADRATKFDFVAGRIAQYFAATSGLTSSR